MTDDLTESSKVWALAISTDESIIVSGAADSVVTFWEDCTEEQELEKESKRAEMVEKYAVFISSSLYVSDGCPLSISSESKTS